MEERFETFTFLISGITKYIRRIKNEEMETFSLKSPHVNCLYSLYKEKSMTLRELCEKLGEDKAHVSRTIDFLEKNGYLTVVEESGKKYRNNIRLTEKGVKTAEEIAVRIDYFLEEISKGIDQKDRETMYKCLAIINNNLKKACENGIGEESYGREN